MRHWRPQTYLVGWAPEVFQMSSLDGYTAAFSSLGATVHQSCFSVFCTGEHFMTLSNITRRGMIGGLAAGVSAAALISSDTFISGARAQPRERRLFWLAAPFCGAWVWRRVSDSLEKQGHKVYPLTLTGLGERSHLLTKDINLDTHIADIVNLVGMGRPDRHLPCRPFLRGLSGIWRARTHRKPCLVHCLG